MTIRSKMLLAKTGMKTYNGIRTNPGSRDPNTGRWVEGSTEAFTVKGNEQPLPGNEIMLLQDSFRSKDTRKFFSLDFLYSLEEASQRTPDKVTIDSVNYEVHKRQSYQMGPRAHYEDVLVREEQSAGGTS